MLRLPIPGQPLLWCTGNTTRATICTYVGRRIGHRQAAVRLSGEAGRGNCEQGLRTSRASTFGWIWRMPGTYVVERSAAGDGILPQICGGRPVSRAAEQAAGRGRHVKTVALHGNIGTDDRNVAVGGACPESGWAADATERGDIVVTAARIATSVSEVPGSVSVISAQALPDATRPGLQRPLRHHL